MSKIGLTNLQMKDIKGEFVPLCSTKEISAAVEDYEPPQWWKDITKPIEFSVTIRAKRKGTILERSLYYRKSKKKRIRKKWELVRVLGIRK